MKLPSQNSRGWLLLARLRSGSLTLAQAAGHLADLSMSAAKLRGDLQALVAVGCAREHRGTYSISDHARKHFDDLEKPAEILPDPVLPMYRPKPRELSSARVVLAEPRPGAFAYRDVPSRMGDERVAYKSSIEVDGK